MDTKTYKIYSDHKGGRITMPCADLDEAHQLAHSAAKLGNDALYRVFEQTDKSVTGEQFVISFSVLNGRVTLLDTPTIPTAHW